MFNVEVSRVIRAPASSIFQRLSALEEAPARSPEPQRFEWTGGTPGTAGASFRGWNKMLGLTWWTNGWITEVDEPHRFAFETSSIYGDRQEHSNRWTYALESQSDGTLVIESLVTLRLPPHLRALGPLLALRRRQIRNGMVTTLDALARECEQS
jgi:hypothetical protein